MKKYAAIFAIRRAFGSSSPARIFSIFAGLTDIARARVIPCTLSMYSASFLIFSNVLLPMFIQARTIYEYEDCVKHYTISPFHSSLRKSCQG